MMLESNFYQDNRFGIYLKINKYLCNPSAEEGANHVFQAKRPFRVIE